MTQYFVYILTNQYNNVLYVGVSNNLIRRVYEHKNKLISGFTSKYNVNKLVYYEVYSSIFDAIKREKEIKGWKREKKIALITSFNPEWKNLYKELI